ncbi:hypothetical protein Tco_1331661 [Tanacetum coccineum]
MISLGLQVEFFEGWKPVASLIGCGGSDRGGSRVFDSWDREILLNDALAASRAWCDQKKKKDASLDLVVSEPSTVAAGSQPKVATIALIPAIDPTVTSSASTIGVSQEPLIAVTNYHISDLTMDEIEAQHDV